MPKVLTPVEKAEQDAIRAVKKAEVLARRAAKKVEVTKVKQFKHRMEIIRTLCAIFAVVLNLFVLTHILGFW
jgi:hypothetical protein